VAYQRHANRDIALIAPCIAASEREPERRAETVLVAMPTRPDPAASRLPRAMPTTAAVERIERSSIDTMPSVR